MIKGNATCHWSEDVTDQNCQEQKSTNTVEFTVDQVGVLTKVERVELPKTIKFLLFDGTHFDKLIIIILTNQQVVVSDWCIIIK